MSAITSTNDRVLNRRSFLRVSAAAASGERAITVVPRLSLKLAGNWGDTAIEIPPGRWRNELTGETIKDGEIPMAALFKRFPVALLSREGKST